MSDTIEIIRKLGYDKNKEISKIEFKEVEKKSIEERIHDIDGGDNHLNEEVNNQRAKAIDKKKHIEREIVELRDKIRDIDVEIRNLTLQLQYGG
jgi:predicted  nucleic acid-binding Zn-ribbon protein|tara:strand:+ start:153 stop:434 length:282 start_codon:yes stop_codon:yes gene_type:complete